MKLVRVRHGKIAGRSVAQYKRRAGFKQAPRGMSSRWTNHIHTRTRSLQIRTNVPILTCDASTA